MKYAGLMTLGIYLNLLVTTTLLWRSAKVTDVRVNGGYVSVSGSVDARVQNSPRSMKIEGPVTIESPVQVTPAKNQKFMVEVGNRAPIAVASGPGSSLSAMAPSAENQKLADATLPRGHAVSHKWGFVYSPYANGEFNSRFMLDFRGVPEGTKVECPFTHGYFILPKPLE
jgi:hypothetical protein